MAKYSRYDPRNKKNRRHKVRDMEKDFRIHRTEKSTRQGKRKLMKQFETDDWEDDNILV